MGRAAAARRRVLLFGQASSIGLRSGEYGGATCRAAPTPARLGIS